MSKIQKAIRNIEKESHNQPTAGEQRILGKLAKARADVGEHARAEQVALGDETLALVALGINSVPGHKVEVDREALRASGFIAPEDEERAIIDQYRQIKRPLVAHAFGKRATKIEDGHLILVTSALAGDGKTFSCINLALSLAREQDRSVLLVDADIAKAHVSRLFGIEDQKGLMDLLEPDSTLTLSDVILATDVDGLSVMSAGQMHAHSTELLASNRMESLIKALTAQDPDRIVLFDSSPLLATSESRVLSTLMGQVVMVVCAGQTPKPAVLDAIAMIEEGKAVNLVLNQVRNVSGDGYYGYGYGEGSRQSTNLDGEE